MTKFLLLFLNLFTSIFLFSQNWITPDRYRFYRERLNNYFIYVGPNPGESLPFAGRASYTIKTEDMGDHIGWYLAVLATEYHLLVLSNANTDKVIRELHYALFALNRLDQTEAGIGNTELDGFLIREDFPADFLDNTANGHKSTLNQGLPYPAGDDMQLLPCTTHNGATIEPPTYGPAGNAMSMDHYDRLFMGLALIKKYVNAICYDCITANGSFQDGETNIRQEAINITHRIITYMKNGGWFLWMPTDYPDNINSISDFIESNSNCFKPWQWFNPLGEPCENCWLLTGGQILAPRGCIPLVQCYGIAKAGEFITGQNYEDGITALDKPFWDAAKLESVSDMAYSHGGNLAMASILAAIGDSWNSSINSDHDTQYFINRLDNANGKWRVYTLLHTALHSILQSVLDEDHLDNDIKNRFLNAPCIGPNNMDYRWFDNNMFDIFAQVNDDGGEPNWTYNGLDYMLLYNLYYINFRNDFELPPYTTNLIGYDNNSSLITNSNIDWNIDLPYQRPFAPNCWDPNEDPFFASLYNPSCCPICPNYTELGGQMLPLEMTAINTITAYKKVKSDGIVTFKAGEEISLEDGFEVETGAEFEAFIEPTYCAWGGYARIENPNDSGKTKSSFFDANNISDIVLPFNVQIKNSRPNSFIDETNDNDNFFITAREKTPDKKNSWKNKKVSEINVIPNPSANGFFNVTGHIVGNTVSISVFNILGGPVLDGSIVPKNTIFISSQNQLFTFPIDLSTHSKGIYFLKISDGEEMTVQKIVYQ